MPSTHDRFRSFDLDRIATGSFVRQIHFQSQLPSTNDLALQLAQQPDVQLPLLVLAEQQTAGRGRGAHRWWSAAGALTFSLLLEMTAAELPAERWPQVSLTAGLAVCEALQALLPGSEIGLKWPNDVYLRGGKVCGILIEVPSRGMSRLVVGIGINVNNSFASAPDELQARATSLADVAQYRWDLTDVLLRVLRQLETELQLLAGQAPQLQQRWQAWSLLEGRTVHLTAGSHHIVGVCQGIDEHGALVLHTETGPQRCLSGVITRFD